MTDKEYIELAIEEAKRSTEPLRCGVVIVRDSQIVAKAFNSQRADKNATAHAEIKAIAQASKKLGSKNLESCVVYATCEPCTMCLSAMVFAKVKKLVYGVSLKDFYPLRIDLDIDTFISKCSYKFGVVKNFMEAECRELN